VLQFTKLRLSGFKSFVDPTDLPVAPGLTGIVGPNGCGKSNLVEALRWVMGETSAKQMRGGEMDDVIFGGTSNRPARNIAEVLLSVDNAARVAPSQFNEFPELDISRRIERGTGSTYRVNGREVRARDVQLLFADSATGARSTAMVSQGRVGAVINAKPVQRRGLLEEAAGITGLHSRRHEAELRLKGAETNLERLEDIMGTLEAQLQGLKKQARQATRYRNLSDHIRKAEAALFLLRWLAAEATLEDSRGRMRAAETRVGETTGQAAAAATAQAEAAAVLPDLRQAEATAAAQVHRLTVARESLDAEQARVVAAMAEAANRIAQTDADIERERNLAADAGAALTRLGEEEAAIVLERAGEDDARTAALQARDEAAAAVTVLEGEVTALTDRAAADEAARNSLARRIAELEERARRIAARLAETAGQRQAAEADTIAPESVAAAESALAEGRALLETARGQADAAERARAEAGSVMDAAIAARQEADAAFTRLRADEDALARLLEAGETDLWPPLVDAIAVEPGYEAALAAALGDDLSAPTDEAAPVHWRTLPPVTGDAALPAGTRSLSEVVKGPPALDRRLARIGIVDDVATGERLMPSLTAGQRLVSRDGALWRWDGYAARPGALTGAAARLEQRNRLREVRSHIDGARTDAEGAAGRLADARAAVAAAVQAEREARDRSRAADREAARLADALAALKERAARQDSRLVALAETARNLTADAEETAARQAEAQATLADLPDGSAARERIAALRADLDGRRGVLVERRSALDTLVRDIERRRRRLGEIAGEAQSWNRRQEGSAQRIAELTERRAEVAAERERLAGRPAEIEAQRGSLMTTLEEAEAARRQAADMLAAAEARLVEADRGVREADAALAAAREDRVRAESAVQHGEQDRESLIERIVERLDCRPEALRGLAELAPDASLPDLDATEGRVQRLLRERDGMGPVNLRAEQEAAELGEQLQTLVSERDDLVQAIGKLRRGIAELNREGRERLLASFQEVDRHFQDLFQRLFGGGRAHLQLTDSDDPLEAGLEIMASPPGKRLQVLSLLSGGEQALTALALLFAVFMTNPAPICVLDEVDAPLDDANVDRFCSLVEEIAHTGSTRFLVITHHRMTMARMDRLFGVTMSEKGVSQLVSVDLHQADALRQTA